jgi:hypothetical protein
MRMVGDCPANRIRGSAEGPCGDLRSPCACETASVSRRLLLPLGLAVTGLLVLAAVASRGRPLEGGSGATGPTAGFFDYVFTTVVLLAAAVAVVSTVSVLSLRLEWRRPRHSSGRRYLASMIGFVAALALGWALVHSGFEKHLQQLQQNAKPGQTQAQPAKPAPVPKGTRGARLRWDEVAVVLALLAGTGAVVFAVRARGRAPAPHWRRASQEAVSLALDESLDDLRSEPDLRKAIIAAYARMERALALGGLARRPAEAPLEYLERALLELETSAAGVRRLTDLFEWAKFSQHEPEPRMRDEAIDALVAVRDELREQAADAKAVAA